MAKCKEDTFVKVGFKNWKKAVEKFQNHERSYAHKLSVASLIAWNKSDGVDVQLNKQMRADQVLAQKALLKILTSLWYLAQQRLAIRGKDATGGNFRALLNLRAEDDDNLKSWLKQKISHTSPEQQNEMLQLMSHKVLRELCTEINKSSATNKSTFGIIIDGTQDCTGQEQEAICIRYVDVNLNVREEFIGLYRMSSTTGLSLCKMLKDVLIRFQLPIENLRAQTYDGASNMSGIYHSCQAEIKKVQPLASYTHCGAHVSHLVVSKAVPSSPFIRDALDCLQELGKLYKGSGRFKNLYLHPDNDDDDNVDGCHNYEDVIKALRTASSEFGTNVASRATGLLKFLKSAKCILGLVAALPIIKCLENFNKALQGNTINISGMLEAAERVKNELQRLRSEETFREVFKDTEEKIEKWKLDPLVIRKHRIPSRYDTGGGESDLSIEGLYRSEYYKVLDSASVNMINYFTSTDIEEQQRLASMLLEGEYHQDLVNKYPELSDSLRLNISFFYSQYQASSVEEYRTINTRLSCQLCRSRAIFQYSSAYEDMAS
ncbi:zinc finger MYM-type protein 1-like [Saccoglossus kowalevskii]